jgi:hypothetical protein
MMSSLLGLLGVLALPTLQVGNSEIERQLQRFIDVVNANDGVALAAISPRRLQWG